MSILRFGLISHCPQLEGIAKLFRPWVTFWKFVLDFVIRLIHIEEKFNRILKALRPIMFLQKIPTANIKYRGVEVQESLMAYSFVL
jgi:hypothetical protein